MVEKFDQVLEEHVLSEQSKNGKGQRITRHSNQRFNAVPKAVPRMFRKIAATEQSPFQKITARAARWRDYLVDHRFVTPNKRTSLFYQAPEKVYVFACSIKLSSKRCVEARQDASAE
jgi:hypothetical protein